jgi:hypothetical protein
LNRFNHQSSALGLLWFFYPLVGTWGLASGTAARQSQRKSYPSSAPRSILALFLGRK